MANKKGRDYGLNEVGSRFQNAGDGKPRIYVYSGCKNLIRELQVYDESKKQFDHAVDALRYTVGNLDEATSEIQISFGKAIKRDWRKGFSYRG